MPSPSAPRPHSTSAFASGDESSSAAGIATTTQPVRRPASGGKLTLPDGRSVELGALPLSIGRSESADLTVSGADVSALHCEVRAGHQGVLLRDLDSTNGTFVGALRVHEVELVAPCTILIASVPLRFEPAVTEASAAPARLDGFGPIVGSSDAMQDLYGVLGAVAPTEFSVLVTGETGTGKELVARALHEASARKSGPFVVVDCGALPATLAESILFGHEKGSFTGAVGRTNGAFLDANGGTLFLDELGELPEELQPKLLRAIAERSIKRVGGARYEDVDIRFVAATRRDLRKEMNARRFREDLFFRLAQVRVETPPLRDRLDDVAAIVTSVCRRLDRLDSVDHVIGHILHRFRSYDWPGNVRELVNVASVLSVLGAGANESVLDAVLPREGAGRDSTPREDAASADEFVVAKRHFEERYFRALLDATGGNISEVARQCGLARHQVRAHLKKLGLA